MAVLASLTFRICLSFVFFGLQLCWSGLSCCLLDICFVLSHPVHFLSPHRSTVSCLILAHLLFLASSVFVTHDNNVKFYIRTFCLGSKLQVFGSNHSPQEKFLVIASSSPAWSATAGELLVLWRCLGEHLPLMPAKKGSKRTIRKQTLRSCMPLCAIQSLHAWQIVSFSWLRRKPHYLESNAVHVPTAGQYNFLCWFLFVAFVSDECTGQMTPKHGDCTRHLIRPLVLGQLHMRLWTTPTQFRRVEGVNVTIMTIVLVVILSIWYWHILQNSKG